MTNEERTEYMKLSHTGREAYDMAKKQHPNWSHSQLMAKAKVSEQIDAGIDQGKDVNRNDILAQILSAAKGWLQRNTKIDPEVLTLLEQAIYALVNGVGKVVKWLLS